MVVYTGTPQGDTISHSDPLSPDITTLPPSAGPPSSFVADSIRGLGGDDVLAGGGDLDTMRGGRGDDTITGYDSGDQLFGDAGDDVLVALSSTGPSDEFHGGKGTDTLYAGVAWDLSGATLAGLEVLDLGDDGFLRLGADDLEAFDTVTASSPDDEVGLLLTSGGNASVALRDIGLLRLLGSDEQEVLVLTSVGATATDVEVEAGEGNDWIVTGAGDDTLRGEGGTTR